MRVWGKITCVCVCVDVCLFVGFWNHILLYYYVPFLCATPKPMNWAKQSKWSLVPLNTPWAGGSVWPFAAQHLSTTVSVSSLSFNLSLSHPGSTVQRLSLLHYTMRATFFVAVFSLAYRFVQVQADTRRYVCYDTSTVHIYIHALLQHDTPPCCHTVCWAEGNGWVSVRADEQHEHKKKRREGKEEAGPILQSLCYTY